MTAADLFERVRSGVIRIEHLLNGEVVASGTGFLTKEHLLTNHHVFRGPCGATVRLSSQATKSENSLRSVDVTPAEWSESFKSGSPENNHDFAILSVAALKMPGAHEFSLQAPEGTRVGDPIAILGFPFGCANLVCHLGIVSSMYMKNGVNILQLDASVNVSNSGGPLLDLATGHVIGIVTRKAHGLTAQLKELKKITTANKAMADNLSLGPKPEAGISMGHSFKESCDAQVTLIKEIERSANVGIGYAFSIERVLADNLLAE